MNTEKPTAEDLSGYLCTYMDKCMEYEKTRTKNHSPDFYGVTEKGLFKNQEEAFRKMLAESLDVTEAYWFVREKIQEFQREKGISGIVWREVSYRGKTVRVPSVHDQLVSIPGDKEILIVATPDILSWWAEVTEGMNLWMSVPSDDERDEKCVPINLEEILVSAPLAEWAEVHLWEYPETNIVNVETNERWTEPTFELNLELAWGIPENVPYAGHPESGSAWFSATRQKLGVSKLNDIFNKDNGQTDG